MKETLTKRSYNYFKNLEFNLEQCPQDELSDFKQIKLEECRFESVYLFNIIMDDFIFEHEIQRDTFRTRFPFYYPFKQIEQAYIDFLINKKITDFYLHQITELLATLVLMEDQAL